MVSVEAAADVAVLGSYAAVVLRRNLAAWLAAGPDVRHSLVLPAAGHCIHLQQHVVYDGNCALVHCWDHGCWLVRKVIDGQCWLPQAGFVYVQDLHNWRPQDDAEWEAHAEDIMDYVAWRRSALEFLPGLMAAGQDHLQLAPVLAAIAGEAEIFTYALEELKAPGDDGWPEPPEGVPRNHWWWWPGVPTPEGVVSQFAEAYAEECSDSEGSD